jgi:hypothetical protein
MQAPSPLVVVLVETGAAHSTSARRCGFLIGIFRRAGADWSLAYLSALGRLNAGAADLDQST